MEIKKIINNKEKYMNLILEADPDENVVNNYINKRENKNDCKIDLACGDVEIELFIKYCKSK